MKRFASDVAAGSAGLRGGRGLHWLLGLSVIPFAVPAHAGTFSLGEEVSVDYIVNLSYAAAYRLRDPSQALINGPTDPASGLPTTVNADDGNRNFKRGKMINNRLSVLGDFDIKYRNYGAFLRASSFYDDVYQHSNDNDSPETVNKDGDYDQFTSRARRLEENRTRLLDAYLYTSQQTGDESMLNLRLGQQVVQWGESLFFPNIAGAQSPVDATKANVPGTEVKDILLPVGQLSAQWQLSPLFGVSAYYQYQYKPSELDPVGTYFSYTDVVGPGAEFIRAAPGFNIPRGPDHHPRNSGQWGLSTHFAVTSETDVNLYYLRYHDKNPNVEVHYQDDVPVDYSVLYFDDISLYGASFSTRLGDFNVAGEVSYKEGVPVLVDSPLGAVATRADATQSNLSTIYLLGPRWFSEQTTFLAEVSALHVNSVDAYGFAGERYTDLTNDTNSWAYQLMVIPSWNNVVDNWDMTLPLSFAQQVKGAAAVAGAFGGLVGQGDKRMSVGVTGKYLNNLELDLTYNGFLGSPDLEKRPLADRDYLAFSAKYSF